MRYWIVCLLLLISIEEGIAQSNSFSLSDTSQQLSGSFTTNAIRFQLGTRGLVRSIDSSDNVSQSDSVLLAMLHFLRKHPKMRVELGVHTDTRGTSWACMSLSKARAKSIVDFFVEKGIPSNQLYPVGYGMADPVISKERIKKVPTVQIQEYLHSLNKRVVLTILPAE